MKKKYIYGVLSLFICISAQFSIAQTISGIINTYTKVNSVTNCSCPTTNCAQINVVSNMGLVAGDRVLIIQMKGALANTTNTFSHGAISALNDAGNYEFATVATVAGSVITTSLPLKETYFTGILPTDSAAVQLIKVPVYSGPVNINGTLTAQAWNGTTGGVLAFETAGVVTLNANINVDGLGFRKAKRLTLSNSCSQDTAFYYQSTIWQTSACGACGYVYDDVPTRLADIGGSSAADVSNNMLGTNTRMAAFRGEGIAHLHFQKIFANGNIAYFDKGKGRWSNGGGGGSTHNGGGGGGANVGAGGFGGKCFNSSACDPAWDYNSRRGVGGAGLVPTATRIFMGGGGGEGHDNGGNGSTGTNGGGIIFIKASTITNGGAFTITAKGIDNTVVANGDGSGGGGAGGSIVLDVPTFSNAITISAKGGKGGDHNNNNCHGTGGGGGGGLIWYLSSCTPVNVTSDVTAGINGRQISATIDCGDVNWGATSGIPGIVKCGIESGATVFLNTANCSLPVNFLSFTGTKRSEYVLLNWITGEKLSILHYEVERSYDGVNYENIGKVSSLNTLGEGNVYTFRDNDVVQHSIHYAYYRIKVVHLDGTYSYSTIIVLSEIQNKKINYFPNPVALGQLLTINFSSFGEHLVSVSLLDVFGRVILTKENVNTHQSLELPILADQFNSGAYFIEIYSGFGNHYIQKFFVE